MYRISVKEGKECGDSVRGQRTGLEDLGKEGRET
jgi:hypothetical protein